MTPDEAISLVRDKIKGRTYYEGQHPHLDEVLVAEIERLRAALEEIIAHMDKNGMGRWKLANLARRTLGRRGKR